jgi:hypothetical protein
MNEQLQLYSIALLSLEHNLKEIYMNSIDISFSHVYREHNTQEDSLSKQVLHMVQNFISKEEHCGGGCNILVTKLL